MLDVEVILPHAEHVISTDGEDTQVRGQTHLTRISAVRIEDVPVPHSTNVTISSRSFFPMSGTIAPSAG
jgi:hypothetical protein